jgi:hypothetical protein
VTRAAALVIAAAVASAVVGGAAGCGPKPGANDVTVDEAILYIHSNVRDAQLYLDGRFIASLNALATGVAVASGVHRIELRREDFFSRYLELTVARAERKQVTLEMVAVLP